MPTHGFKKLTASPSRTLIAATLSFLTAVFLHAWSGRVWVPGVVIGDAADTMSFALLLGPPCVLAFAAFATRPRSVTRFLLLCVAAFVAGICRYDAVLAARPPRLPLPSEKMSTFEGVVAIEPRVGLKGTVLTLDRVFIVVSADGSGPAGGDEPRGAEPETAGTPVGRTMLLTLRTPPDLAIGDTVTWQCKPYMPPTDLDDGQVASPWRCSASWSPKVVAPREGHALANGLLHLKNSVRQAIRRQIPEPDASFVLGLLLGDTGGLPPALVAEFRGVGASHVLAVSGFNVAIVAQFAFVFFAVLRVPRRLAAVFVALSLAGFAALAGGGAPVVRAAVMGGVGVVAALLGRRNAGWAPLLFAAAMMLALHPLALATDAGFKLSFAAVASMRAFGKLVERGLGFVPEAFGLRAAIGETISATLGTLPISLHDFGSFPIAALPANVLIVPIVAFATGMGGLTLLLGLIGGAALPWLAALPAFATALCTSFMRTVATLGNGLAPAIPAQASTLQAMLMCFSLLLLWYAGSRLPEPERRV